MMEYSHSLVLRIEKRKAFAKTILRFGQAAAIVLLQLGSQAMAAAAPQADGAKLQLIRGEIQNGIAEFGLVIEMQPGWHTYWRYPGDSGVPPEITSAGVGNIAGVAVAYPAPKRFGDASDNTIGYEGTVVLPITAKLTDPSAAARLVLNARLGVCRLICLPIDETLAVSLDPSTKANAGDVKRLADAMASVPKPVATGSDLSVTGIRRDESVKPQIVTISVKGPTGQLDDVFVEGPEGWSLPLPARVSGDGTASIWTFALDGLPAGANVQGASLTFTMVGKASATTQSILLQ